MDAYQTAILDALGIVRHTYKDPSVQAFAVEPMLSDLQVAMPQLRFVVSEQVSLTQGVLALPENLSAQKKREIWFAYCKYAHDQ